MLSEVEALRAQLAEARARIRQLEAKQEANDEFIYTVTHELRTPAASIALSATTLRQYFDRLPEERKLEKISGIVEQADALSELVTAILDISRFKARKGRRGHEHVDVGKALHDVVSDLRSQADARQQHLHVEIVNSSLTILGDHVDLIRIWRNLLSNAIKYTDPAGHIRVRLYGAVCDHHEAAPDLSAFAHSLPADFDSAGYIVGIVEDDGHGMTDEDMAKLFTRFFRGWAAETGIAGSGLGLAMVRDLLQLYDGGIAACSTLGAGTTFCFWLPACETRNNPL